MLFCEGAELKIVLEIVLKFEREQGYQSGAPKKVVVAKRAIFSLEGARYSCTQAVRECVEGAQRAQRA